MKFLLSLICLGFSVVYGATNVQSYDRSSSILYDSTESLSLENSIAPDFKSWILHLGYSYKSAPLSYKSEDNKTNLGPVIDLYETLNLGGAIRLNESFAIGLSGALTQAKMNGVFESSLSDVTANVLFKKNISSTSAWGLNGYLTLPTGKSINYTTDSGVGTGLDIMYEKNLSYLQYVAAIGYLYNPSAKDEFDPDLNQTNRVRFKFGTFVPFTQSWAANIEAKKDFTLPQNSNINPNEVRGGLRYAYKPNLAFFGGLGIDSLSNTEQVDSRIYIGLKFFEPEESKKSSVPDNSLKRCTKAENDVIYKTIVHFPNKKSTITAESKADLENLVVYVNEHIKEVKNVEVIGHTSLPGGALYNKKLSTQRAKNIGDQLLALGLPATFIKIIGMGKEQLLSKGNSEVDHEINRRVEVAVVTLKDILKCEEANER